MNDRPRANFDLDELLHPAQAFEDPSEVVNDPDLTLNEKRAILASWASDACAIEAAPELRSGPRGAPVRFDDIMDALRTLDQKADDYRKPLPHYKRVLDPRRARQLGMRPRSRGSGDQGHMLN
jgi:hypothetical protein